MLRPFWIALQFLTTLPIQLKSMPTAQQNAQSVVYYPVVGALIGAVLAGLGYLLLPVAEILAATLLLCVWMFCTGGLHADGLADTADAWVGGFGDPERTLKIMKDPNCGPIGVLSLVFLCLIKWSALYVLMVQQHWVLLILFPILGRMSALLLMMSCRYVRANGIASEIMRNFPKNMAYVTIICCTLSAVSFGLSGVIALAVSLVCLAYLRYQFIKRLGGITGDTIGASIEIVEALSLFTIVCLSFYF